MDLLFTNPAVQGLVALVGLYVAWRLIGPRLSIPVPTLSWDGLASRMLGERYALGKLERLAAREAKAGNYLIAGKVFEDAEMPQRALDTYLAGEEWMAAAFLLEKMPGKAEKAAELFLKAGDYKKAADVYTTAGKAGKAAPLFEEKGNNLEAARLYAVAQQWDKAAALYAKSGYPLRAAEAYEKRGDFMKAAEAYQRHFMENVTFATTYSGPPPASETRNAFRSGQLYERAGAPERARDIYLRGSFFADAARVSLALRQFEKAAEHFLRAEDLAAAADAFEQGGDLAKAANYRGEVAFKSGKLPDAAGFFQQARDFQRAAELFEQLGMLERAASAYEAGDSFANAGNVYLRAGRKDKAAACFERAGEYETAAHLYEETGNGGKAAELYEKAGLTYRSGLAAAGAGELQKAIGLLQRVAPSDENYRDATERLAELFVQAGMSGLAVERLQKALAAEPLQASNIGLHYWLARAHEAAGADSAAVAIYKKILSEDLQFRDAAARVRALGGSKAPEAAAAPRSAARPARFVLKDEVARGPLGVIHRGEDSADGGKPVAMRLLPPEAATHLPALIADLKAAAAFPHPSLVKLLGVVEVSGRRAVITEMVQGGSLGAALAGGRKLAFSQALAVAKALAPALASIHGRGLAHGSIQPSNVMSTAGALKLADLGLGRLHFALVPASPYRAPEARLDPAADVYSFGALLHHLVAGQPPGLPGAVPLPAPFDGLLPRCLAAAPEARPKAREIAAALGVTA